MPLSKFPRLHIAHLPTPLEPLKRLSTELGGPNIWIKRDDCTGLAGGGNKTRKLEFLLADALEKGADIILTQGAVQSNHVRQTAAIAAKLGLACHVLLEHRIEDPDTDYRLNGNVMLDGLFGATIDYRPAGGDMNAELDSLADQLRADGRKPYAIPGGGSNEIGALGYADAALELLYQARNMDLKIDRVVHATGSAGTQAGLVAGLEATNSGVPVLGIGVRAPQEKQEANVLKLAQSTFRLLTDKEGVEASDVNANCNYVGPGYGLPTDSMVEAINMLAKLEGILLDPVYSGKGMAGLIDLIRQGALSSDENIVFIHTGGAQALPAYRSLFSAS